MKWALPIAAAVVFAATALVRYLELNGFPNDQFQHLAGAQQILMGEWPTRDFRDPGLPLMFVTSAAAQLLLGRTLFAEAVLVAVAYGVGAVCTLLAAHRLSRSLIVALAACVISVAIFTRPYGYPKVLLYAAAPLVLWWWARSPTLGRALWLALFIVVAFLFRHDHAVYVGIAALGTAALAPAERWTQRAARVAVLCGLTLIALAPYFLYVEMNGGLGDYVRSGIEYSQREADRTRLLLSAIDSGPEAWLFYGFHALPVVALACVAIDFFRRRSTDALAIVPLAATAILVNFGFLRDPLLARLPDVIVPSVLIGAWLSGRALRVPSTRFRVGAIAACSAIAGASIPSVIAVGNTYEHLDKTGLSDGVTHLPALLVTKTAELRLRFSPGQMPDSRLRPLVPFFTYVDRCTITRQRLLVGGNAPEIFVYTRRMFAGGQSTFIQGYYHSAESQQRVIDRMQHQVVQFVLLFTDNPDWKGFAKIDSFVTAYFEPMVDIPVDEERTVRVLVNPNLEPIRRDAETGWPCYR